MGMSGVDGTGAAAARFLEPRRLQPGEELGSFSCSVELIVDWAAKHASYAAKQGTAVPYVCFTTDGDVAGFYAISAYSIDRETVRGGWLRRNVPAKIPAILLGMLGVDSRFQKRGLGWMLLQDAVKRSLAVSRQIGSRALVVDPYDDASRSFYQHFGFREIPGSGSLFVRLRS